MADASTPTESQWLQFLGKLSSSTPTLWLQFGKKVERTQLPELEFDRIFVLTVHDRNFFEHCIYVVDVNSNSNVYKYPTPSLEPIIRFGFPRDHVVFSIVGTKLYMFGGGKRKHDETGINWSKKMSFYDMSLALCPGTTIDLSNEEDEEVDNLENGPEMAQGKRWAVSVVIGAFKICVFSSILYLKRDDKHPYLKPFHECYLPPNFEVYDTREGSWSELPEPYEEYDMLDPQVSVGVNSYCVHRSSLIIQTILGIYGINIDNPKPKWVKMDGSESIRKFPFEGMWTMVDKQLCNHFKVVRRGDPESYPIALKDSTDRDSLIERSPTGVLCLGGVNNGCIDLCIVRGGLPYAAFPEHEHIPYLLVDIVKFDAEAWKKLGSDLSGWWEIQSDKSFTFSLNSTLSVHMKVIGCFPLKGMDTSMGMDASKDYILQKIKDGLQWVDIAEKVTMGSGEHNLDFDTSHTKGAKGNGYFGRLHQEESHRTVACGHAVGLPSRLQRILQHLFG